MDAVAYSLASKQAQRIEKFIENPDSTSGIVTVPKVIASGETITIPSGRVAVLPNVQVDGTLNIDGEVFIPSGATFGDLEAQIALKAPLSSLVGYKNLLINPNFLIKQRDYVSGTNTTAANQYAHDRWRISTIGQNVAFTTTNNVTTVTAPSGGYEQVIENINVQSGDYKISHEGTATISVAESTDNITYTTLTINVNGTYTLTGGKYVRVRFSSGTVIKPQVELGSVRTPFEQRPIGLELSLCQRYYQTLNTTFSETVSSNGGVSVKTAPLATTMRTQPTVVEGYEAGVNVASIDFSTSTNSALRVGHVTGGSAWYRKSFYMLSAEL